MATDAAPRSRDLRWLRTTGWYLLLTVLAAIILFPVWMTFVRALSNPVTWSFERGQPPYPVDVEWDVFTRAFNEANFDRQFVISAGELFYRLRHQV